MFVIYWQKEYHSDPNENNSGKIIKQFRFALAFFCNLPPKKMSLSRISLFIIGFSLLIVSCKKQKHEPNPGIAGLVAFNLAPDQNQLMITLDGSYFTSSPLLYSRYTGKYFGVYEGDRTIVSFNNATNIDLAKVDFHFRDSGYYSLFFIGYKNHYRNFIVEDKLSAIPKSTGKSYIRYLYAIPDSLGAHVTISNAGIKAFDESNTYGNISDFKQTAPGNADVKILNGSGDIDVQRTVNLEPDGIYTVLLQGTTQSTDTLQKVKINLIQNGVAK